MRSRCARKISGSEYTRAGSVRATRISASISNDIRAMVTTPIQWRSVTEAFAIVLHSHLPYARGAGRWPHGEEWVHEAILGTYLPLLGLLHDLRDDGVPYRITIGLTPPLLEQLVDPDIDKRFIEYVDDQIKRADQDTKRFGGNGDSSRGSLAMFYRSLFRAQRSAYLDRFSRDVVGAFAALARTGHIEILTSGATHGYL